MSNKEDELERDRLRKRFRRWVEERSALREEDLIDSESPDKFLGAPGYNEEKETVKKISVEDCNKEEAGDE